MCVDPGGALESQKLASAEVREPAPPDVEVHPDVRVVQQRECLFYFLGDVLLKTEDKDVHFMYIEGDQGGQPAGCRARHA